MVKFILDIADNGVVKTVIDDNSNGAGGSLETKTVYDFSNDIKFKRKMEFFYDLANDLGINTGNNFEKNTLTMSLDWGKNYTPTKAEILKKIKSLNIKISALEQLLEENIEEYDTNKSD